jgi:L-2-hydroxyglutarate oxidase
VTHRIGVIGGGIVGLATAYRLLHRLPLAQVTVLEKESAIAQHQSSHNSGVLHCGLYYKTGSARARLAVRGIRQMVEFCRQHSIPHDVCGKVVVATTREEVERLPGLFDRGTQNGLEGLRMLSAEELREIEPHSAGLAAIHVPQEGIADYPRVCEVLAHEIHLSGGHVVTSARVQEIRRDGKFWRITHTHGETQCDWLVSCAGLYSDRVAALTGRPRAARIVPFRGEYYMLRPERQFLVRNLIYPVPDPRFPFLGVHFTRRIQGGIEAGPNAVLAFAREGYNKSNISLRDLADAFSYSGFWRFVRRYPRVCWDELRRSFSKELFCQTLQKLVPEIQMSDLAPGGAGVRAQALSTEGMLIDDFRFVEGEHEIHVVNAPSPAATSSLAIGDEIAGMLTARL